MAGASLNILDQYLKSSPSPQLALDLFKGEWSSKLPQEFTGFQAGPLPLFADPRLEWAIEKLGGVSGQDVLELGPLEGGHTYMLERVGKARSVLAIESNTRAYLKCLIIKEILQLQHSRFLLGDFVSFLRDTQQKFDAVVASGVLYHMLDPIELLTLIAGVTDRVFIWTHYYDYGIIGANPVLAAKFTGSVSRAYEGRQYELFRQEYQAALDWQGFCGGSTEYSHWIRREDILELLKRMGFLNIQVNFEQPDHPNGPAFAIVAAKD